MTGWSCLLRMARASALALAFGLSMAPAGAADLGVEGQVFVPIEEDFRLMLMRMMARHNWESEQQALKDSAKAYTRNLPQYSRPRADKTRTLWKDVGIVTTEDIYLPWVEWETGSVFEPEQRLAVPKGTYLNPIAHIPAAGIERLFVFDATDPEQLAAAKALMRLNIPQLSFMLVAGDLGPLSEEMNRPVFHPSAGMLEKFEITAVPSLVGFGIGKHQGHLAVTQLALPIKPETIQAAWYGLPYKGYDPQAALKAWQQGQSSAIKEGASK